MTEPINASQTAADSVLRALRRTRQVRQFTDGPVAESDLRAILEVARWSGSSTNRQPWTFIVLRSRAVRERLAELAPYARHVAGAPLGIAIAMGGDNPEWDAYDEGRAAERMLVAAGALDLGAGIGWVQDAQRPAVAALLGLTAPAFVRTIVSLGHPTDAARQPRSAPGTARRPLADIVQER
jgi:nitroreductase